MTNLVRALFAAGLVLGPAGLVGCGASGPGTGAGLTTASILGDTPSAASGETLGIRNDDPMARPVQVGWTSARAQKCGFNFDAARLKSTYLAYEASQGGNVANAEKIYDQTANTIRTRTGPAEEYCTDRKSREIKADLTRHLAGDYTPNLPQPKPDVAQCGGIFGGACDQGEKKAFNARDFWNDQQNAKTGTRNAQ
jgi:hypothetical protein